MEELQFVAFIPPSASDWIDKRGHAMNTYSKHPEVFTWTAQKVARWLKAKLARMHTDFARVLVHPV
jgi:hypothetical protein